MLTDKKHELSYKVSVHCNNQKMLDQDGVKILETINKEHSILETAKTLGVSYRHVWNYIQRMQKMLNQPLVETFKGGKDGGGGAKLTEHGKNLLSEYHHVEQFLVDALSASCTANQFQGKVVAVNEGTSAANVDVEINAPLKISTSLTQKEIEKMGIKIGSEVTVIINFAKIKIKK